MRQIKFWLLLWVIGFLFAFSFLVSAYDREIGARPMGMGDAFTALADDANALNYNPAGLGLEKFIQASVEYANLYPGLDEGSIQENHLAYTQALGPANGIGVAWNNRSVYSVYSENEFLLGYGMQPIVDLPLWIGLTTKLFYLGYSQIPSAVLQSYLIHGPDKYQIGLDGGLLYQILSNASGNPEVRAGISVINFNEPDLGLQDQYRHPIETRVGVGVLDSEWDAALDVVVCDSQFSVQAGIEKWFTERCWGIRGGVIARERTDITWTLGGSYAFKVGQVQMRLNYAINYFFGGIKESAGIHRLSLDFIYPWVRGDQGGSLALGSSQITPTGKISEEKFTQIKNYLLEKVNLQIITMQKIQDLKVANPQYLPDLEMAESLNHEAIGQLILYQDIIVFLRKLAEAVKQVEEIEKKIISEKQQTTQ